MMTSAKPNTIISAKKAMDKLKESKEFKEWIGKNKGAYLSHIFYIIGRDKDECHVGYYDSGSNLITSFELGDSVKLLPAEKPFKKDEMVVHEVKIGEIKIDFNDAIFAVETLQKEKYPSEKPIEIIAILQNLDSFGTVFNITYVTHSFKTLNVKVSAENGDVLDEQLISIIQSGLK